MCFCKAKTQHSHCRADIETKEQENESLVARVREAEAQGFMGESKPPLPSLQNKLCSHFQRS